MYVLLAIEILIIEILNNGLNNGRRIGKRGRKALRNDLTLYHKLTALA